MWIFGRISYLKITDVKVRIFRFPPLKFKIHEQYNGIIRSSPWVQRTLNVTEVATDEGIVGVCPGGDKEKIEGRIRRAIIGEDPLAVERIWQKLYMGDYRKPVAKGDWITTISHVDMAIWDIVGKASKQPTYKLLGGYADRVPIYAAGGYYFEGKSEQDLADELKGFVEQGYDAVKMKVGAWRFGVSMETDVKRVKAAREAIGSNIKLMVDANNAWTAKEAIKFIKTVERYELYWFEEPVEPDDFEGSAEVKAATSILVASGENEATRWGSRDLIESRAVDVIQVDPGICGGFTEIRKISAMASAHHIWFAPHGGHILGATAVAAAPNGLIVESYPTSKWRPESPIDPNHPEIKLLEESNTIKKGWITLSQKPGLGYYLNEDVAKKYEVKD
ncbi:MAG: Mandelate racemase/muconate lactonizing enzyme family protein [Thermoproteota archaeon]|nr:Mandelate racemase/muconate lactonizing enzyme family protein [Thermoproteota archaeon]